MRWCSSCDRHIRRSERKCPFCGTPVRDAAAPRVGALTLAVALMGCTEEPSPPVGGDSGGTTTTTSGSTDSGTTWGGFESLTNADSTTYDDCETNGCAFIYGVPDGGEAPFECEILLQDCPDQEEKCMPWAYDGGSVWNATRCSPIHDERHQVGEECWVEGNATSGIDTCDLGLQCWDVDPMTNLGVCVAMCKGGMDGEPWCEDPSSVCLYDNDDSIALCLSPCMPLLQDCPSTQACVAYDGQWMCVPDASGDGGAHGQPCELLDGCDPGQVCATTLVPSCEGPGCCTELCDPSDPAASDECPGAAGGESCMPLAGLESVGACASSPIELPPWPVGRAE